MGIGHGRPGLSYATLRRLVRVLPCHTTLLFAPSQSSWLDGAGMFVEVKSGWEVDVMYVCRQTDGLLCFWFGVNASRRVSCLVLSCLVITCHVMSCHVITYYVDYFIIS